jgi:hypothetical protein
VGARPDVQAAYPGVPANDRAGWGYLLLTNQLPNGGNGTYRFHVTIDANGNVIKGRAPSRARKLPITPFERSTR